MNKCLPHSLFSKFDIYLFRSGKHRKLYNHFGAHLMTTNGVDGCYFAVYAPAARKIEVVGNFNNWKGHGFQLHERDDGSGIWEGFCPGIKEGNLYKYCIYSKLDHRIRYKADPYGRASQRPPNSASIVTRTTHKWQDAKWLKRRGKVQNLNAPLSIYEVHLGSWRRKDNNEYLSYIELADKLVSYVVEMNFTHVEFMPLAEYPYDPSWGYQITGFFAPTSRFGTAKELKYLIDQFHQAGIGVFIDWVPAHFPTDAQGLGDFDGSFLYEHPDRRLGFHPDWNSLIFNFGRSEIRSFLKSSAQYWIEEYHVDGLRVDAVSSMIYRNYSRNDGEWEANIHGGNTYLEAISFFQELNTELQTSYPHIFMMAEEATSYPGVTLPADKGGLGFNFKWMMGWMNDTLDYFSLDPLFRKDHHNQMTFSMMYAYSENFILPLSHDEVVHGKASLLFKMPGDLKWKFAQLRLLFAYMYAHPGGKLLFMGNEIGQSNEWNHQIELSWELLKYKDHRSIQSTVKDLNTLLKNERPLHVDNHDIDGFQWIDADNKDQSIIVFYRREIKKDQYIVVVCNFTPVKFENYQIGVPKAGTYTEIFNSDSSDYSGSNHINEKPIKSIAEPFHGRENSIRINIAPFGAMYFRCKKTYRKKAVRKTKAI